MFRELLLGCGKSIKKTLYLDGSKDFKNVTTLDINPDYNPDKVWDLTRHPLPFPDNTFDEIHIYEVLEHLAQQGDYEFFFKEFTDYHRLLKPNGLFFATVPARESVWAWGDPSHKRTFQPETLAFLSQNEYRLQVGKTAMSDFRYIYKADLEIVYSQEGKNTFSFVLKALK